MASQDTNVAQNSGRGRRVLLILAAIFLLPFTIAATLHLLDFKPGSHSYGDLVNPPRALQFPVLHDAQDKPFSPQQWDKKWSVVTIETGDCSDTCHEQLHSLQQVHASLGKESDRVQRVLLIPGNVSADVMLELQKKYPNLIVLTGADADAIKFTEAFNLSGRDAHIYLIDPLGNLMMSYSHKPEDLDLKGLRKDLTRLLKNSWAG